MICHPVKTKSGWYMVAKVDEPERGSLMACLEIMVLCFCHFSQKGHPRQQRQKLRSNSDFSMQKCVYSFHANLHAPAALLQRYV